jgi:hypothetical protein
MPPLRLERAHFFRHAPAQFRVARCERHHHGFGIFAEQTEEPSLEPLLHVSNLVFHRTAEAASGMTAAIAVTG